jgi:hypothetical protein
MTWSDGIRVHPAFLIFPKGNIDPYSEEQSFRYESF